MSADTTTINLGGGIDIQSTIRYATSAAPTGPFSYQPNPSEAPMLRHGLMSMAWDKYSVKPALLLQYSAPFTAPLPADCGTVYFARMPHLAFRTLGGDPNLDPLYYKPQCKVVPDANGNNTIVKLTLGWSHTLVAPGEFPRLCLAFYCANVSRIICFPADV